MQDEISQTFIDAVTGDVAQFAADLGATASQLVALTNVPKKRGEKDVKAKSGINFVLYNQNLEVVEANTGTQVVDDKINTM